MKGIFSILAILGFFASAGVTVGTGETLVVTDENIADYAEGLAFADATGTIEFWTSVPPAVNVTGKGTVIKKYVGDWTFAGDIKYFTEFTGRFVLEGAGVVTAPTTSNYMGYWNAAPIEILDGATLRHTGTDSINGYQKIYIQGFGHEGRGAIEFTGSFPNSAYGALRNLTLNGDAMIAFTGNAGHYLGSGYHPNLNGHRLLIKGYGKMQARNVWIKGDGDIVLQGAGENERLLFTLENSLPEAGRAGDWALAGHAVFQFGYPSNSLATAYDQANVMARDLKVSGVGNVIDYWCAANNIYKDAFGTTNGPGWRGAIAFTNETGLAALNITDSNRFLPNTMFTVSGPISGPGSVLAGMSSHYLTFAGTNTFTGAFRMVGHRDTDSHGGQTVLWGPYAVPETAAKSADTGAVWARFDPEDETAWDAASFWRLVNETVWTNNAWAGFDLSAYASGEAAIPLGNVTNDCALGARGAAVRLTDLAGGSLPSNFTWRTGTGTLDGTGKFAFDAFTLTNVKPNDELFASGPATFVLDGGVDIAFGETPFLVGAGNTSPTWGQLARLVVKNASLHAACTNNATRPPSVNPREFALVVGDKDNDGGILEICDGAVVSNRLMVGGCYDVSKSQGLVIQRGGQVYVPGLIDGNGYYNCGIGMRGQGHYEMLGGNFDATDWFLIGGYNTGSWRQKGGRASFTGKVRVGGLNYTWAWLDVQGGTFTSNGTRIDMNMDNSGTTYALMVVRGVNTLLEAGEIWANYSAGNGLHTSAIVVKDGATVRARFMRQGLTADTNEDGSQRFYIVFDGGRYVTTASFNDIFANDWANPGMLPSHVLLRGKGLTLETTGQSDNAARTCATLSSPYGGGVTGVTGFDAPLKGFDYLAPPYVIIEGDGQGAFALPMYDVETGTCTGVEIIEPGVGYTQATAKLYSRKNNITNFVCTVSEDVNAVSGPFVKTGEGNLNLYSTNTYRGATVVSGGSLTAMCDWALPTNTVVKLSGGGTLNLNKKEARISEIVYGPGKGTIANAGAAELPDGPVVLELTAQDVAEGASIDFEESVDLSQYKLRLTGDWGALNPKEGMRRTLVTATGGFTGGFAAVEGGEALPKNWEVRVRGGCVYLAYRSTLAISFR